MADDTSRRESPWFRAGFIFWVKWALLGAGVLVFGALSAHGLYVLANPGAKIFPESFLIALATFGLGGGITIGVLALAWWLANPRGFRWGLGLVVLALLLFALFVWPTPFKYYYRKDDLGVVVKINRVTGKVEHCVRPHPPAAPDAATSCR